MKPEIAGELEALSTERLFAIHDSAGPMQRPLLERYEGTLPIPLRGDLEYYDGAQFFLLHIAQTLEETGHASVLTREEHLLVNATNGVSDWWIDESGWAEDGTRDYDTVVDIFDGINAICYSHLYPDSTEKLVEADNPEVQYVVDFYDHVLKQVPPEHKASLAKLLISVNLYQGLSLYQEKGFREHMGFTGLDFEGRDIGQSDLDMLDRMRIEKGGFMLTYPWPYFPGLSDCIVVPDEPPTIEGNIERFLSGHSLYSEDHRLGRRLLEIGGILQHMDDSCDREEDWGRGVVSPENTEPAYGIRGGESWGDMVERVLAELTALMDVEDAADQPAVDAAAMAVAGLARYRAGRYSNDPAEAIYAV